MADNAIRGWLENQVRRNQNLIKQLEMARPPISQLSRNRRTKAEAAAIIRVAGSCLDHLDAEAKQARADDAEDLAALLAEGNPAIP